MKNNTLFVFNAEANNKKKVVYMGRSEVGGGETCFSLKNIASASLAYSTFAFLTSNQARELKK